MPRAILCMTKANTSSDFAFGSADSKLRIMSQVNVKPKVQDSN
jgi:hypothetical protein